MIHFVLNRPSHPGNIGASARALKVMGFDKLDLVQPDQFPHSNADAMATHAKDILTTAKVYEDLSAALTDKHIVFALTARNRDVNWPKLDTREAAQKIWEFADSGNKVAIVFGREDSGLSNDDLAKSNYLVHILSNQGSNSLNLSQAVQIMAYELFMVKANKKKLMQQFRMDETPATNGEVSHLISHLNQVMEETGFLEGKQDNRLKIRLQRIFQKAQLDKQEATLFRGILASVIRYQNHKNEID